MLNFGIFALDFEMFFCPFRLTYPSESLEISWYTWRRLIPKVSANNFNIFLELAFFKNQALILKLNFLFFWPKI